jgi:hypothetical protein
MGVSSGSYTSLMDQAWTRRVDLDLIPCCVELLSAEKGGCGEQVFKRRTSSQDQPLSGGPVNWQRTKKSVQIGDVG